MNIAFDVDGVLWDIESFQLQYGAEFFGPRGVLPVNPNGFGIGDIFGCTHREEVKFWARNLPRGFFMKARAHAEEVVRELKEMGNNIFIITSRYKTSEHSLLGMFMRELVRAWLKRNRIVYDRIVFCDDADEGQSKVRACRRLKVDVIVEDRWENIEELKKVTSVIGFRTRNNQDYEDDGVAFVKSFLEIKAEIERLKAKALR